MDISSDWAIAIVMTLVLALICKLTANRLNSQVDTMFDGMPDTRTQRFFMIFDGQPQPLSVTEAGKFIDENGGNLEIEGTYNQRAVKVTVKTADFSGKLSQDVVAGHSYAMDCSSNFKFEIARDNIDSFSTEMEEMDSLSESLSGIKVVTDNKELCLKFLEKPDISDSVAHLINLSNIKQLSSNGSLLLIEDEDPKTGENLIRIKTLFETQHKFAQALEEVT